MDDTLRSRTIGALGLLLLFGGVGCGSVADVTTAGKPESSASVTERIARLDSDLSTGSHGDDVSAVQQYLATYGYFPNAALAQKYPSWRPIVAVSPTPGSFDQTTVEAVRAFQAESTIPVTGVVDAATRELLRAAHCERPAGLPRADQSDKYNLEGGKWTNTTISWHLNANLHPLPSISYAQAHDAIAAAFAVWQAQTALTLVESTSVGQITVSFGATSPSSALGTADAPQGNNAAENIVINNQLTWSVTAESLKYDLQSGALHLIGHALGLADSNAPAAEAMRPTLGTGANARSTAADDDVAISSLYDTWEQLPGAAMDVGSTYNTFIGEVTWIVGSNNTIFKWDEPSHNWIQATGGLVGFRIAVDANGIPWVVDPNHVVYHRTSADPLSGIWVNVGAPCALDIAANPSIASDVRIVGCDPRTGGYAMLALDGGVWHTDDTGRGALRISVASDGIPWITDSTTAIFKRSQGGYGNTGNDFWTQLPGAGWDIGITDPGYPALIGTTYVFMGFTIFLGGDDGHTWNMLPGWANNISTGINGRAWITNDHNFVFRSPR